MSDTNQSLMKKSSADINNDSIGTSITILPAIRNEGFLNKFMSSIYIQSSDFLSSLKIRKRFNYCCFKVAQYLVWAFLEPLFTEEMLKPDWVYVPWTQEERFRSNKFLFSLAYQARIRIPFIITSVFLLFNLPVLQVEINIDIR